MIVSVPFAFQVHSLQELVKLETELARRTGCRAQVKRPTQAKQFTTTTLSSQATTHYKARKYFTDRSLESFIQRDHRIQVLIVN